MPVPTFTEDGLLPQGVHACTLDELERALGRGGQRASLMAKLRQYATLLREAWGAGLRMIVDGSFVTKEPSPNDVDVVVLIHEVLAGEAPLPLQATSINRAWVNKTYGELIDTRGTSDAAGAAYWIDFFQQHKDSAERKKGVLEVTL